MATTKPGDRIDDLIQAEKWPEARALIEQALKAEPRSHWLLTQLGETHYEERQYKKALDVLLRSRKIVPDCPLTLWHLAGTLDALGSHADALRLYTWLLQSNKTPEDDPCWESMEWTNALKTDCIFRIGLCFKHLEREDLAEHCFRKYLHLAEMGMTGSYSAAEVKKHLSKSRPSKHKAVQDELSETAAWVAQSSEQALTASRPPEIHLTSLPE